MHLTWTTHTAEYAADLSLTLDDIQAIFTSPTTHRERLYDILTNEPNRTIVTIKPAGTLTTTSTHDTRRTSGGTTTGSIPSTTTELLTRARRAGFGVSLAGSGHHKIWASGTPRQGRSVTIPATASDHRSLLNSVMTIRSVLGIDLRKY